MTYDTENRCGEMTRDKLKSLRRCGGLVAPNVPGILSQVAPGLQSPSTLSLVSISASTVYLPDPKHF